MLQRDYSIDKIKAIKGMDFIQTVIDGPNEENY